MGDFWVAAVALAAVVIFGVLLHFLLNFVEDVLVLAFDCLDLHLNLADEHSLEHAVS